MALASTGDPQLHCTASELVIGRALVCFLLLPFRPMTGAQAKLAGILNATIGFLDISSAYIKIQVRS